MKKFVKNINKIKKKNMSVVLFLIISVSSSVQSTLILKGHLILYILFSFRNINIL